MSSPTPLRSRGAAGIAGDTARPWRRWRGLLWPISALTAGLVAIIAVLLVYAAAEQNRLALEASQHLAGRALESELKKLAGQARDYTNWDDATQNLVVALDEDWADGNIGSWAYDGLGIGATLIVDGQDQPFYAMLDGLRIENTTFETLPGEAAPGGLVSLIAAVRGSEVTPLGLSLTGYVVLDGRLAMAAAAPIMWEDGSLALDRGEGRSVLIFFRWLDEAFLAQLEEDFLLPDLQLSPGGQSAGRAHTHLTAYSGETLGTLHWTAEQPGYAMLRALILPGLIAALLTVLLLGLVVRRAGRTLRELETSHAKLQSQAAELTAARDKAEQQIQVETELRHNADAASRAKSEFLALISHELRTPLNAILGFSETIARQTFGRNAFDRYREYAQHIHDSGTHLLSIINDILDLSKVEARRFELNEEDVLLGKVLERCVTLVRERASEKNLDLAFEDNELWVRVDERALKQILINLLTNAIKFTGAGGRVAITSQSTEEGLEIAVSDSGIGMTKEGLARAMLPFGQAASALTRSVEGTGLGLNVTQALTQLHGGYLTIHSTPGEGTTASVHLPAARILGLRAKAAS